MDRPALDIFELEDELPDGWYLHRFGIGQRMAICLQPVSYIGHSICKSSAVSNDHAVVELLADGSWFIKDLKSKHGTYVNDKIIPEAGLVLEEWDVICLGRKRPRSAKDFGFMLKYKDISSSEKSCSIRTEPSSCVAPSTLKASVSENGTYHLVQDKSQNISKRSNTTSPILISDDSCEGDKSGNDSDRTIKLPQNLPTTRDNLNQAIHNDIPVLQQETTSVKQKIDDWLLKNETPSGSATGWREKSKKSRKSTKRNYVDSDDNWSDSASSSRTEYRGYQTRKGHKNSARSTCEKWPESLISSSNDSDTEKSDGSNFNLSLRTKAMSKRRKHNRYYEDRPWNPNVNGYARKWCD